VQPVPSGQRTKEVDSPGIKALHQQARARQSRLSQLLCPLLISFFRLAPASVPGAAILGIFLTHGLAASQGYADHYTIPASGRQMDGQAILQWLGAKCKPEPFVSPFNTFGE